MNEKGRVVHLEMSAELFDALQKTASERDQSVEELLRTFIKLGMVAVAIEASPNSALIISDPAGQRELLL